MRKRLFAAGLAVALLAGACGGDDDTAADTTTDGDTTDGAVEGPQTVPVNVDGETDSGSVAFLGYFPSEVTVRQGDTVEFAFQPGDPHTVTFGTLIDDSLAEMASGQEPATFERVPLALSEDGTQVIASAALPCFTADDPPVDGSPCEETEQPDFDGSLALYNSGLLFPSGAFSTPIADDAAPGTYNYICLLHGPDMSGSITVVAADEPVPSSDEVEAAGEQELAATVASLQPALDAQPTGTLPGLEGIIPEGPDQVLAGGGTEEIPADILQFGPDEVTIAAGESVTWNVIGAHTVSFNATQDATPPIVVGEDGLPAVNPLAFAPQNGPGMPPPPEGEPPPQEGPPAFTVIDAGEFDGNGFLSSGLFFSFPPALFSYEVTFTTSGTYNYVCLIHPDMEGTVNVT